MLYFNNELIKEKKGDLEKKFQKFLSLYAANFDANKRVRNDNPFILKYKASMIKDDPDNKGKKLMPASVPLKLVTFVNIDGNMVEVRYSSVAPQTSKEGPKFPANVIQVERGYMAIYDIDLAFYMWAFSTQNFENHPDKSDAYFIIENPEAERASIALAKRNEATALARIWNEEQDGGLSERRLRTVAKDMMINNADSMDINLLKQIIEDSIRREKGTNSNRDLFLSLSDPHKSIEQAKQAEDYADKKAIITESIAKELISHNTVGNKFFLNDVNFKPEELLFDYSEYKKSGDKTNRQELLFIHIAENRPELLDELKAKLDAIKELASA